MKNYLYICALSPVLYLAGATFPWVLTPAGVGLALIALELCYRKVAPSLGLEGSADAASAVTSESAVEQLTSANAAPSPDVALNDGTLPATTVSPDSVPVVRLADVPPVSIVTQVSGARSPGVAALLAVEDPSALVSPYIGQESVSDDTAQPFSVASFNMDRLIDSPEAENPGPGMRFAGLEAAYAASDEGWAS